MSARPLREVVAEMLASPVAFHPVLARISGSVTAGLMLSQGVYWAKVLERTNPQAQGWFYKTQAEWTAEVCLSRWEQDGARKLLRACPFWEEKREGAPPRSYFRVDLGKLIDAIVSDVEKPHSRMRKNQPPEDGKTFIQNVENRRSLIGTKTSSETTKRRSAPFNSPVDSREAAGGNTNRRGADLSLFNSEGGSEPHGTVPAGQLRAAIARTAAAKDLARSLPETDAEQSHFEAGIFRKRIEAGYFDSLNAGFSHRRAIGEAVRGGVLTLTANRAVELRGIGNEAVEDAVWARIEPHVDGWFQIANYSDRLRVMMGVLVRVTAEEARRLRQSLPKSPSSMGPQAFEFLRPLSAEPGPPKTSVSGGAA